MYNSIWAFVVVILLLSSCTLTEEFPYGSDDDQIVLNGLLHPDSLVTITVTQSGRYPGGSNFEIKTDADINLYENNEWIGRLNYIKEEGLYRLNYFPKEGMNYKIIASVPGYSQLSAATFIPEKPMIEACYSRLTIVDENDKTNINAEIIDKNHLNSYWCSVVSRTFKSIKMDTFPYSYTDSSQTIDNLLTYLYSTSSLIDKFNAYNDRGLNEYSYYIRINQGNSIHHLRFDLFSFNTNYFFPYSRMENLHENQGLYLNVYIASEEFDRYWKSCMLSYLNSAVTDAAFNPFVETITSYSNIENGYGIFAGYNSVSIPVHLNPCN